MALRQPEFAAKLSMVKYQDFKKMWLLLVKTQFFDNLLQSKDIWAWQFFIQVSAC